MWQKQSEICSWSCVLIGSEPIRIKACDWSRALESQSQSESSCILIGPERCKLHCDWLHSDFADVFFQSFVNKEKAVWRGFHSGQHVLWLTSMFLAILKESVQVFDILLTAITASILYIVIIVAAVMVNSKYNRNRSHALKLSQWLLLLNLIVI